MSPSPRIFAIVGILLIPVGILWALEGRGVGKPAAASPTIQSDRQWQREMVFQESFALGSGTIDVHVADADVEVRAGDGGAVIVEGWVSARDMDWGREVFRRSDFRAALSDNTVRVDVGEARVTRDEWRRNRGIGIVTIVTIPRDFNVRVSTSDGDVDIEAVRGDVYAHTSDGDISIQEVVGGRVTLETSDGDVSVGSLSGTDLRIETSDGDIDLRSVLGPLDASTSDGDITVRIERDGGDIALRTGDGDITMYAPTTLRADVILEGEDLEVARGFELQGSMGRRTIRGTLNGGGARISARTGDGEIALRTRGG